MARQSLRATVSASMNEKRPRSAFALIAFAVLIEMVELGRYWLMDHPLHWPPQVIAAVIGFIGFYIRDPKQAKEGTTFIIDGMGAVVGIVFRTGRRAGDVKVVAPERADQTLPPTVGANRRKEHDESRREPPGRSG